MVQPCTGKHQENVKQTDCGDKEDTGIFVNQAVQTETTTGKKVLTGAELGLYLVLKLNLHDTYLFFHS